MKQLYCPHRAYHSLEYDYGDQDNGQISFSCDTSRELF
jgi:hypothetical protein